MYIYVLAGSNAIPPVASLDITYATAWKANYSKDHYDDEPDAGVGVEGENFKKFTCQRARHGRRLPVSFSLFLENPTIFNIIRWAAGSL